jgi:hypothetical protein
LTVSIYDLVHEYIRIFFKNEKVKKEKKKRIHNEIKELLAKGWCADELMEGFKAYKKKYPDAKTTLVTTMFTMRAKKKKNLLKPGKFYYHNDLRLTSRPPRKEIDYDSGEIKTISEPYFLEMRADYTIDDLVNYYIKQFRLNPHPNDRKRYRGSLQYLLKQESLETLLFMIDANANYCQSEDRPAPRTPLDITEFAKEALEAKSAKVTETALAGGKRIVRKKRVRTS